MDRNDDFDAARGILTGCVLSLGLVFGCALLGHLIASWVGAWSPTRTKAASAAAGAGGRTAARPRRRASRPSKTELTAPRGATSASPPRSSQRWGR